MLHAYRDKGFNECWVSKTEQQRGIKYHRKEKKLINRMGSNEAWLIKIQETKLVAEHVEGEDHSMS